MEAAPCPPPATTSGAFLIHALALFFLLLGQVVDLFLFSFLPSFLSFTPPPTWPQLQAGRQRGGVDQPHVPQPQAAPGPHQDERERLVKVRPLGQYEPAGAGWEWLVGCSWLRGCGWAGACTEGECVGRHCFSGRQISR